jgi:hypothetical protein
MPYDFFSFHGPQFGLTTLTALSATPLAVLVYIVVFRRALRPGLRDGRSPRQIRLAALTVALASAGVVMTLDAAAPFGWVFLGLVFLVALARLAWSRAMVGPAVLAGLALIVRAFVLAVVG